MTGGRVCIIGAGVSGLTAVKACLEEGLQPVCYERYDNIGGIWDFSPSVKKGQGASVYEGLITNISKERMCFSDFPMPAYFTPIITHRQYKQYLLDYAEAFDLLQHIVCQAEVLRVEENVDYEVTGRWKVTVRTKGTLSVEIFDFVMVASGFFKLPNIPRLDGIDTFTGKAFHTHAFRTTDDLRGKTVVVIGNGVSAGDVAALVSNVAKKLYLSVGSGAWIFTKSTFDLLMRRVVAYLPKWLKGKILTTLINSHVDHAQIGIAPDRPLSSSYQVMISDDLRSKFYCGAVVVKDRVVRIEGTTLHCSDGKEIRDVDVIIFATGFSQSYPFLSDRIISGKYENTSLYRLVWPTELPHPTLAMIGYFTIAGSGPPTSELQARWAAGVCSGRLHLPPRDVMRAEAQARKDAVYKRLGAYKLRMDIRYMDELAEELGCRPRILRALLTDPRVGFRLLLGPLYSVQWRLQGVHSWSKARDYFLTAHERTVRSLQTRKPPKTRQSSWFDACGTILAASMFILMFIQFTMYLLL